VLVPAGGEVDAALAGREDLTAVLIWGSAFLGAG
jgi:hypothetical protein